MIRIFRILLGFGFITAIYTIIFLLAIYPLKPNGAVGWLIFSGLGIPFVLFLEWLGGFVFSKKLGQKISSNPFSIGRIIYALGFFLLIFACVFFLWRAFGPWLGGHFSKY
jgi:hypothetical protein